jgi:putative oxidoreductase
MNKVLSLLRLDFLPRSVDAGLLILRVWLGLSMALLHGKAKLLGYSQMAGRFPDVTGLGSSVSLSLAIFAELVCGLLLVLGLFTRFAALNLVITMAVAFFVAHAATLAPGPKSGELAFIYLAGFIALLVAGGGRYSLDAKLGAGRGER